MTFTKCWEQNCYKSGGTLPSQKLVPRNIWEKRTIFVPKNIREKRTIFVPRKHWKKGPFLSLIEKFLSMRYKGRFPHSLTFTNETNNTRTSGSQLKFLAVSRFSDWWWGYFSSKIFGPCFFNDCRILITFKPLNGKASSGLLPQTSEALLGVGGKAAAKESCE